MNTNVGKGGHPAFYKKLEEVAKIHADKNHDYATVEEPLSNLQRSKRIGIPPWKGCLIRMQDKFDRIENFANTGSLHVKSELLEETLMDLAAYSILCIILYEERDAVKPAPDLKIE